MKRKLVLKVSTTLDGFLCGPGGEFDWFMKTRSPEGLAWTMEKLGQASAFLVGRKSFEAMAPFWGSSKDSATQCMNDIAKIVFTQKGYDPSSLPASAGDWAQSEVISGDLSSAIQKLKNQEGKPLIAMGGANFAQSLVATGLIDEFWLVRHPVAIGQGKELFSKLNHPLYFKLLETKTFSAGTVASMYVRELFQS